MPTYSFRCNECGLRFEKSLKINDDHSINCISCKTSNTQKLPPKGVGFSMKEPTSIPKEIDLKVGADSEKRWEEIEKRNKTKEEVRQKYGTQRLEKGPDGEYRPFSFTKNGEQVSESEGVNLRKQMLNEYLEVKRDPETKKVNFDE